jgi:hypothetical protein
MGKTFLFATLYIAGSCFASEIPELNCTGSTKLPGPKASYHLDISISGQAHFSEVLNGMTTPLGDLTCRIHHPPPMPHHPMGYNRLVCTSWPSEDAPHTGFQVQFDDHLVPMQFGDGFAELEIDGNPIKVTPDSLGFTSFTCD